MNIFKGESHEDGEMSKKKSCLIEVEVPSGPKGWQKTVDCEMKRVLDDLKNAIKELGGRVYVRY